MVSAEHAITFDEATHVYRAGSLVVPSVTQVLAEAGFSDWLRYVQPDALAYAAARGTAVHAALHFLDEGTLDYDTVDPSITPYLDAYDRFRSECDWFPVEIEQIVYHSRFGYAGRVDRVGVLNGAKCILDFKSGLVSPVVALQLAAYAGTFAEPSTYARYGLQLKGDGTYRLHEYPRAEFRGDFAVFCSALCVAQFKRLKEIR